MAPFPLPDVVLLASRETRASLFDDKKRKRLVGTTRYENDTLRIQGELDKLPMVLVRDVEDMRPREVRRALVRLECDEADGVVEFEDLKALYRSQLERLGDCSVCLSTPTNGEFALFLSCGHAFHRHCIHAWAQDDYESGCRAMGDTWYRPRCPNCRSNAL